MGYGLVNAYAALREAQRHEELELTITTSTPVEDMVKNTPYVVTASTVHPDLPYPSFSWEITSMYGSTPTTVDLISQLGEYRKEITFTRADSYTIKVTATSGSNTISNEINVNLLRFRDFKPEITLAPRFEPIGRVDYNIGDQVRGVISFDNPKAVLNPVFKIQLMDQNKRIIECNPVITARNEYSANFRITLNTEVSGLFVIEGSTIGKPDREISIDPPIGFNPGEIVNPGKVIIYKAHKNLLVGAVGSKIVMPRLFSTLEGRTWRILYHPLKITGIETPLIFDIRNTNSTASPFDIVFDTGSTGLLPIYPKDRLDEAITKLQLNNRNIFESAQFKVYRSSDGLEIPVILKYAQVRSIQILLPHVTFPTVGKYRVEVKVDLSEGGLFRDRIYTGSAIFEISNNTGVITY